MSRCFPFPPPGYEKRTRIDDADFLAKEKHKEKKHKKDKKDKEKKEGKEKKDKERSKQKHREKKDRKEKYKEKDKDREKEKKGTSDENKVEGQPQTSSAQKFTPNSIQNTEIKDQKYVQELARRIRDEDRATGSQAGQRVTATEPRRAEIQAKMVENNIDSRAEEKEKANYKKEDIRKINGQRNHYVETRGLENSTVQKFSVMDQRRVEGVTKPMEKKDMGKQIERKEENKCKGNNGEVYKHKDSDRESKDKDRNKEKKKEEKAKEIGKPSKALPKPKSGGKDSPLTFNVKSPSIGQSSAAEGNLGKRKQPETNGILLGDKELPKLKSGGKDSPLTFNVKSPAIGQGSAADGNLGKHKQPDTNGNLLGDKELPKLKSGGKDSPLTFSVKSPSIGQSSAAEGNLGKRKHPETNGILLDNGLRPSKLPRPVSSSHPVVENGRKLEPSQAANQIAFEKQDAANNCKGNVKEHNINGLLEAQRPSLCSTRPSSSSVLVDENGEASKKPWPSSSSVRVDENSEASKKPRPSSSSVLVDENVEASKRPRPSSSSVQVDENGESSKKPPHPDMKYLSQILSVPKVDLPDLDDEAWLFGSNSQPSKKPKVGSSVPDETLQVWDEALQIESADVVALPYVIPY